MMGVPSVDEHWRGSHEPVRIVGNIHCFSIFSRCGIVGSLFGNAGGTDEKKSVFPFSGIDFSGKHGTVLQVIQTEKTVRVIFLVFFVFSAIADEFYIWQRNWNGAVRHAVRTERSAEGFYFLEGELERGRFLHGFADRALLASRKIPAVPVYRIHAELLNRFSSCEIAEKICDPAFSAVQLDLDCPERLFPRYAELVRELKRKGVRRVSATVLPVHLKHRAFPEFAKELEFYVLQVHGLDFGKGASLMRKSVVADSLNRAERLGFPYKVALPCYGYELFFRDDRLVSLNAEQGRAGKGGERVVLSADLEQLAECVKLIRERKRGIIWFRLPVPGDRLCLDRDSLQRIMDGKKVGKKIRAYWKNSKNGLQILCVENVAWIGSERIRIHLNWDRCRVEDYAFTGGFVPADRHVFGIPPSVLSGFAPLSGQGVSAMWCRTNDELPEPAVEVLP